MKKIITIVLAIAAIAMLSTNAFATNATPESWCAECQVMTDGRYEDPVTRAELCQVIYNIFGRPRDIISLDLPDGESVKFRIHNVYFSDVSPLDWCYEAIRFVSINLDERLIQLEAHRAAEFMAIKMYPNGTLDSDEASLFLANFFGDASREYFESTEYKPIFTRGDLAQATYWCYLNILKTTPYSVKSLQDWTPTRAPIVPFA